MNIIADKLLFGIDEEGEAPNTFIHIYDEKKDFVLNLMYSDFENEDAEITVMIIDQIWTKVAKIECYVKPNSLTIEVPENLRNHINNEEVIRASFDIPDDKYQEMLRYLRIIFQGKEKLCISNT